jgi:hypothetical protein
MVLKSIVLGLVLANVTYYLWAHGIADPEGAPLSVPEPTLTLVSEGPRVESAVSAGAGSIGSGGGMTAGAPPAAAGPTGDAASGTGGAAGTPGPQGGGSRCITVGPFHDVAEAAHAATLLRGGGYDPRQRVVEGELWAGEWVYLQMPTNPAAGEQLLTKLKAAGIDDALEMPGPGEGSVISIGLFSDQKHAQARVAQAWALGLKPGIADRKRTGNLYWVDLDLKATDSVLNPADLQSEAGRITRLEVKTCPVAAAQP